MGMKWLYRRIGQILCFTLGAAFILFSSDYSGQIKTGNILTSAMFFAIGLVLRHQFLKQQQAERAKRDDL